MQIPFRSIRSAGPRFATAYEFKALRALQKKISAMLATFNRHVFAVALAGLASISSANAASHTNKQVADLLAPDYRPCTFFQLQGVAEADPVNPNNPWFAVPNDHIGYDEIVSMLITATTSQRQITVATNGNLACGHARVFQLRY